MVEIRWTDEAVKWLRDIYDYIAQDSTSAAAKVVSGIYGITLDQPVVPLGWRVSRGPHKIFW